MKYGVLIIAAFSAALQAFAHTGAYQPAGSGIQLLYYRDSGWLSADSWIQINTLPGQTPIQRVPMENDDVVFSNSMSGIDSVNIGADSIIVGGSISASLICHSLHVSGTYVGLGSVSPIFMGDGTFISVYTSNGGYILIDSGSVIFKGLFQLNGGDATVADLSVYNSTLKQYFSHGSWGSVSGSDYSRINFVNSYFDGRSFSLGKHAHVLASNSTFDTYVFTVGDNSMDSIMNCRIGCVTDGFIYYLTLGFGKNSILVSSANTIFEAYGTNIYTSGCSLKADLVPGLVDYTTALSFIQEDTAHPLPNIIDGNISMPLDWSGGLAIQGELRVSGNLSWNSNIFAASNDSTGLHVNGNEVFQIGGIRNFYQSTTVSACITGYCHYKLVFFGDQNSDIYWPIGFPVDTLVVAKSNCAKLTITNPLYVASETRIDSGQLTLYPNAGVPYKFVCGGNVNILQGGGLLLQRDSLGNAANIAIRGAINDNNITGDSTCHGLSNPYGGLITFFSGPLPITFSDLSGTYLQQSVLLRWQVADQQNVRAYTIEKSFDAATFSQIGNVNAMQNITTGSYQFTDNGTMAPDMYYRVKVTDYDGKFSYSKIIRIKAAMPGISIYPNPVADHCLLKNLPIATPIHLSILNVTGSSVKEMDIYSTSSMVDINTAHMPGGMYILLIREPHATSVAKFIKQ